VKIRWFRYIVGTRPHSGSGHVILLNLLGKTIYLNIFVSHLVTVYEDQWPRAISGVSYRVVTYMLGLLTCKPTFSTVRSRDPQRLEGTSYGKDPLCRVERQVPYYLTQSGKTRHQWHAQQRVRLVLPEPGSRNRLHSSRWGN
jgi:hypothetical protein